MIGLTSVGLILKPQRQLPFLENYTQYGFDAGMCTDREKQLTELSIYIDTLGAISGRDKFNDGQCVHSL